MKPRNPGTQEPDQRSVECGDDQVAGVENVIPCVCMFQYVLGPRNLDKKQGNEASQCTERGRQQMCQEV
jgi:hypothetical protein